MGQMKNHPFIGATCIIIGINCGWWFLTRGWPLFLALNCFAFITPLIVVVGINLIVGKNHAGNDRND